MDGPARRSSSELGEPGDTRLTELLIDCEEDRTLWAVVGMLRRLPTALTASEARAAREPAV